MIELFFEAFILGLVAGAIPGPILTGVFTEILGFNLVKGLRVVFYAFIAETIGALLALLIVYSLGLPVLVFRIISIGGAVVLFWLAFNIWKVKEYNIGIKTIFSFRKILVLTALNSGYWIFWLTVGISKAFILDGIIIGGKFIFLGIFELAWLVSTVMLAVIFSQFRPILEKKKLIGTTFKILAAVLIILGIKTFFSTPIKIP